MTRVDQLSPKSKSNTEDVSLRDVVRGWMESSTWTKVKYAVYLKNKLEETLADLESWHHRFDPSWYLLVRLPIGEDVSLPDNSHPGSSIKELAILERLKSAHVANRQTRDLDITAFCLESDSISARAEIRHSCAETALYRNQSVIVDSRKIPLIAGSRDVLAQGVLRDTRDLVRILGNVDSETFGLLSCKWAVKNMDEKHELTGVELLFKIPDGYSGQYIKSLRETLLDGHLHQSLDSRFRLARFLARSISFLHSAGIVHKNIRPETVLLLTQESSTAEDHNAIGKPFLVGFERFRYAEAQTHMSGDSRWEKNLYRHPGRQGEYPEERYKMQHDIYSLGVCLLEIGLGRSFVHFDDDETARPAPALPIEEHLKKKDPKSKAFQIKRELGKMAETLLPGCMGTVYTHLVLSCLTCLDVGNAYFGGEEHFKDQDGILVAVRYIEKVCPKAATILCPSRGVQ